MALNHNRKSSSLYHLIAPKHSSTSSEHKVCSGQPTISIIIKPIDKIRFRYETEKGSHGVLTGVKSDSSKSKKDYPTVKLENYNRNKSVKIKVSLYTHDENQAHVLDLICKCCNNGACVKKLGTDMTATFQLSIRNKKRSEVFDILMKRKLQNCGSFDNDLPKDIQAEVEIEAKNINLNEAKLCFEAFEEETSKFICRTFSDIIRNSKNPETGDLKICHLSKDEGSCSGGEEITLLCDKVKKENIRVHFYEEDQSGDIVWEDYGLYSKSDWHHQVALIFKTPRYKENIKKQVNIKLVRESDGSSSEAKKFCYLPDETESALKIVHLSRVAGSTKGGEEITFLCEKVKKEDIQVHFYEEECGEVKWEAFGEFSKADWHHEVALICKTPPYKDNVEKLVFVRLVRVSDGLHSEARQFCYHPDETDLIRKRKRPKLHEDIYSANDAEILRPCTDSFNEELEKDFADILESFGVPYLFDEVLEPSYHIGAEVSNFDFDMDCIGSNEIVSSDSVSENAPKRCLQNTSDEKSSFSNSTEKQVLKKSLKYKFISQAIISFLNTNNMKSFFEFAFHILPRINDEENNLLHMVVLNQSDNLSFVSKLLTSMPSFVNFQNKRKQTALHLAVVGNSIPLLKLLLAHGANPSSQDKKGDTCFHIACRKKSAEMLSELLSVTQDKDGLSIKNYEGLAPLHVAVLEEAIKCVHLLAVAGADLNIIEHKHGKTSLHFAIENASTKILHILLSQDKIEENVKDFSGRTFVKYAEALNRRDLLKNLPKSYDLTSQISEDLLDENSSTSTVVTSLRALSFSMDEDEPDETGCDSIHFLDKRQIKELCNLLDPPSNDWRKLGAYLVDDFNPDSILRLRYESPTKLLLKYLQKHYPENPLDTLKTMISLADLVCDSVGFN